MNRLFWLTSIGVGFLGLAVSLVRADDPSAALIRELQAVAKSKMPASPEARAAWDKLVARGPAVLPTLLEAMDTPDTVVANWLRTAFDRIVTSERSKGGKGIDTGALLRVVENPKHQGRVRRLALEVVEELRPGTTAWLVGGWLDDPEFNYDAVAALETQAESLAKAGMKDKATELRRKAFTASRDVGQAQAIAARLRETGDTVSLTRHFGFLTDWYVIGPLDAHKQKGFTTVYPPEEKVDLTAELRGKAGGVTWKRYSAREAPAAAPARVALVNLVEPLGNAEDAVAFAYTEIRVPRAQEVEFRGSADDNFTVWVNGSRVFGFEEYRNGVRLDRHRFGVKLQEGVNRVLVKVCQAPSDPSNPDPNWEFLLRISDTTGRGVAFESALAAK